VVGAKLFKKGLKLLLLVLKRLVFAMAALARALAVREDGLNAAPARAEVRALLPGRGVVEGMIGVMWVVPAMLLKLYMLLENAGEV
jgi:hypothetical protein